MGEKGEKEWKGNWIYMNFVITQCESIGVMYRVNSTCYINCKCKYTPMIAFQFAVRNTRDNT